MNPSGSAFSGEVRCHVWKIPVHGQSFSTHMDLAIIEIRQVVIPVTRVTPFASLGYVTRATLVTIGQLEGVC